MGKPGRLLAVLWASTGVRLAVLATSWLIVVNAGSFGTVDTRLRLHMADAWWAHLPEVTPEQAKPTSREDIDVGVRGVGGRRYIFYDPGQSVLMLPGDWAARLVDRLVHAPRNTEMRMEVVNWAVFLPLNLAVVLSAWWVLLQLGFEARLAA